MTDNLEKNQNFPVVSFNLDDLVNFDILSEEEAKEMTYEELLEVVSKVKDMYESEDLLNKLSIACKLVKNKNS